MTARSSTRLEIDSSHGGNTPVDSEIGYPIALTLLVLALYAGDSSLGRLLGSEIAIELRSVLGVATCFATFITIASSGRVPRNSVAAQFGLVVILAWFGYLLISAMWAPQGAYLVEYVLDVVWLGIFTVVSSALSRRVTERDLRYLAKLIFSIGIVFALQAIITGPGNQSRYSAFGGGPNVFVRIVLISAIFALLLLYVQRRLVFLLPFPLLLSAAFLSGSRGGLVAAVGAMLIFGLLFIGSFRRFVRVILLASSGIATFSLVVLFVPGLGEWIDARFIGTLFGTEVYTSGRDILFLQAWQSYLENPLLGGGIAGFVEQHEGQYPHNLILHSLAEGGVLGTFLLLFSLAVNAVAYLRSRKFNPYAVAFCIASAFVFLASLFSGSYFDSRLVWVFMVFSVGIAINNPAPSHSYGRAAG